jgi:hypothetical protein
MLSGKFMDAKRVRAFTWLNKNRNRVICERGNVESALTLIPLMILFLTVTQVCISVYSRTTQSQMTQGAVAYAAMGSSQLSGGLGSENWSSAPIALPLPGGGSILVGERVHHNPTIAPFLPGGDVFTSTGIAIQE